MLDEQKVPALDLRQLHYFLALAEHGSISSAASSLGLAQPSLSENVARLEKRLDVQLAIRGARGVQLTEAGLALVKHGREIVRNAEVAIEEIRYLGGEARGPVSVGLPPSLGLLLTVPLAETIQNELPSIRLHVAEAMSGHILDWVGSERLQIGCVYDIPDSAPLSAQPLLIEELFVVTAPDNWDGLIGNDGRAVEQIDAAKLATLPLVLTSATQGARKIVERYARANGIQLNVVTEIDSLPHIIEMVSRASAYTILPHTAVVDQVAAGTLALVPMVEPNIRRTAYLVRKRSKPVSRASLVVESTIKMIVRELIDRKRLQATLPCQTRAEFVDFYDAKKVDAVSA
jgi:LysR family nitrogen assimilation transcriptional regulator